MNDTPEEPIVEDAKPRGWSKCFDRNNHDLTADRIIEQHFTLNGERTLYLIQNAFYNWNGSYYNEMEPHWIRVAVTKALNEGKHPKAHVYKDAEGIQHKAYALESYKPLIEHINNVVNQLRSKCYAEPMSAPSWIGGKPKEMPPADELAPVANGLLHMPTGRLIEPTPLFFCTRAGDVAYDVSKIKCPEWDKYLDWLFGDDVDGRMTQEELMAYCMVSSNKFQKAFFLSSAGRGGKGTRMQVLEAILGQGASVPCDMHDFHAMKDTNLTKCIGAAVMHFDEPVFSGGMDKSGASSKIKAITGDTPISISRKYLGQWRGKITAKIIMTGNESPDLHDSSGVISDRFIIIRTEATAAKNPIPFYFERFLKPELSAILNRIVIAYNRLMERGRFLNPESGRHLLEGIDEGSAPIKDWILSNVHVELCEGAMLERARAFDLYEMYAENMGRKGAGNHSSFARAINSANLPGVKACQTNPGEVGAKRIRVIRGIRATLKYDAERRATEARNVSYLEDDKPRKSGFITKKERNVES